MLGVAAGNALTGWLVGRVASERLILAGTATSVLAAGGLLALALSHRLGTPALVRGLHAGLHLRRLNGWSRAKSADAAPAVPDARHALLLKTMHIVYSIAKLRERLAPFRKPAFVATIGNLHGGHMALVETARTLGDVTVCAAPSISNTTIQSPWVES